MSNTSNTTDLSSLLLADKTLKIDFTNWLMLPAEQMAMIYFLHNLRPKIAIEIGTYWGGSLQILSHFSSKVYALDSDPEVPQRLAGKHKNVEYLIGNSAETLTVLLKKLENEKAEVSFILVDGDHNTEAVRKDIETILKYKPCVPLYVLMHDSFNGLCRKGMLLADWKSCPYVHSVEIDYVVGIAHYEPQIRGQLWAGLALAVLLPEPRKGELTIMQRGAMSHERLYCLEQNVNKPDKQKWNLSAMLQRLTAPTHKKSFNK